MKRSDPYANQPLISILEYIKIVYSSPRSQDLFFSNSWDSKENGLLDASKASFDSILFSKNHKSNDPSPIIKLDSPLISFKDSVQMDISLNKSIEDPISQFDNIHPEIRETNSLSKEAESKQKTRRGRKQRELTEEDQVLNQQKRMEKNRLFAKQNRMRKKEYIATLEAKLENLTKELKECYKQIEEYKRRDEERHKNFIEFCLNAKNEIGELQGKIWNNFFEVLNNTKQTSEVVPAHIQTMLDDKYDAIELMVEMIFKFLMPLIYRFLLNSAEIDPNIDS